MSVDGFLLTILYFPVHVNLALINHNSNDIINPRPKFRRISAFQCPPIDRLFTSKIYTLG